MSTDLAVIHVELIGPGVATHNMPCAVCRSRPAVLNLDEGVFSPCWECQERRWEITQRSPVMRGLPLAIVVLLASVFAIAVAGKIGYEIGRAALAVKESAE